MAALAAASLFVGKYPLTLSGLLAGDEMQVRVFWTLRFSRTVMGAAGGFALGAAGFVYQTVFRNPLASPDVIGVSSGASAGAAAGILFLSGAAEVTLAAFGGALAAVGLALALSTLDRSGRKGTIVLAGVAVHALAQTALMSLKLMADPEKELASIEYWIMGSLNGISGYSIGGNMVLCAVCVMALFLLHPTDPAAGRRGRGGPDAGGPGGTAASGGPAGRHSGGVLRGEPHRAHQLCGTAGPPWGPAADPAAMAPAPCCWEACWEASC